MPTRMGHHEHPCNRGDRDDPPEEQQEDAVLAQLEMLEAEARQRHDEDEMEDIFGHGGDLGEAAYEELLVVDSGTATPEPAATAPQQAVVTKRAAAVEVQRDAKRTCSRTPGFVNASLDGLESRLAALGELPRFVAVGPGGRQLQHQCRLSAAAVNFWPATLQWSVEGPGGSTVEAALLRPPPSEEEECGCCLTPPLPSVASYQ